MLLIKHLVSFIMFPEEFHKCFYLIENECKMILIPFLTCQEGCVYSKPF